MPARSHFWTSRRMRVSPTRCSRKRMTHCWETSVKNDRISASSMKFTFLLLIPTMSASSASCWLRCGRNPYENPRKSSSWIALSTAAVALWTILFFESRHRERALAPVFLRNVTPTGRRRPIRPSFDPRMQVLNPAIEVAFVGLPCHAVHAWRGVTLHRVKRRFQHGGVDMVQERSELLLLPLPCGLPYAFQRL